MHINFKLFVTNVLQVLAATKKGLERVIVSTSSPAHVLKAFQPPGGLREVTFYEKISSSSDPQLQQWRAIAPKFHGLKNLTKKDGTTSQYMILGFKKITLYFITLF